VSTLMNRCIEARRTNNLRNAGWTNKDNLVKSAVATDFSRPIKQEVFVSQIRSYCVYVSMNIPVRIIHIEEATTGLLSELPQR